MVDYHVDYSALEFHNHNPYKRVESVGDLIDESKPYYLVMHAEQYPDLKNDLPDSKILQTFPWIRQEKFIPTLFNLEKRKKDTEELVLILVPETAKKARK